MNTTIIPSFFIPHGGGPWNLMGDEYMKKSGEIQIQKYFRLLGERMQDIDAIVMLTSHWEEKNISVSFVEEYNLLYDYAGFPDSTYNINYPVRGNLLLAEKIETLVRDAGIETQRDTKRGLDHGSFIPLMEMFPNIHIPVVQVSISRNLDSKFHYELGKALAPLKKERVLILGSGMSYHNMRGFFSHDEKYRNASLVFNRFLEENISNPQALLEWEKLDIAGEVHPRPEHFMPFFTILGTSFDGKMQRDFVADTHGIEIVGYKTY